MSKRAKGSFITGCKDVEEVADKIAWAGGIVPFFCDYVSLVDITDESLKKAVLHMQLAIAEVEKRLEELGVEVDYL